MKKFKKRLEKVFANNCATVELFKDSPKKLEIHWEEHEKHVRSLSGQELEDEITKLENALENIKIEEIDRVKKESLRKFKLKSKLKKLGFDEEDLKSLKELL